MVSKAESEIETTTETRAENFVKPGHLFFEICSRTDKQTNGQARYTTSHPYQGK